MWGRGRGTYAILHAICNRCMIRFEGYYGSRDLYGRDFPETIIQW